MESVSDSCGGLNSLPIEERPAASVLQKIMTVN